MDHHTLKEKHRALRENFHENLSLRTHRALSWLKKSELSEDVDSKFIFLWIAFNAAYATDVDQQYRTTERGIFEEFFGKIISLDNDDRLYQLVWSEFSGSIRLLLNNEFIYQPYWDYHNGKIAEQEWKDSFSFSKSRANAGLGSRDTKAILSVVFRRLYTLRNQMIHGGATWDSSANREQLKQCTSFLGKTVPIIIDLMMESPNQLWGDAFYPFVKQ